MASVDYPSLLSNKLLYERSRLLILSFLMGQEKQRAAFMEIQKNLDLTRGNLSIQAKKLEEAGYISIKKEFKNNKSLTTIKLSPLGTKALNTYLKDVESLLKNLK
ncbi:MAG: ArsR family transcriptional regulator [Spirochaetales bacterium]|jgi:DNA-binding MarR family transcriptional regulator|nr:ArsR family transcriptional regulator [Spirochaetales bacterium]